MSTKNCNIKKKKSRISKKVHIKNSKETKFDQKFQTVFDKAVQIVKLDDENSFTLDEEALAGILLDTRVCNSKVMVLSVAGASRKGKSFLLNFFIRYLKNLNIQDDLVSNDWMGKDDVPLEGFKWKSGSEGITSGVLMWSEPYFISMSDGEKICILLMDTQGTFDCKSTIKETAVVFALSTMLSSLQVLNISGNIQEDDLHHLEFFTEYGRIASETNEAKPFQTLQFLVRDWQNPFEYAYGDEGGKRLLESKTKLRENQKEELQKVRRHLKDCFEHINCSLMPHPGSKIYTKQDFAGKLEELDEDFQVYVKKFTEEMFKPSDIVVKKINNKDLTGKDLFVYFKVYMKWLQGTDLPNPKSMLNATAEANNMIAVAYAKDLYTKQMEKECGGKQTYIKDVDLYVCHDKCIHNALNEFKTTRKMGGNELSKKFETQLEKELLGLYESLKENNDLIRIKDEKNNESAVAEAKDLYNTKMQEFCRRENPHLKGDLFYLLDTRSRTEAMELFAIKRMGSDEFSKTYEMELVKELDHEHQIHVKNNESNLIKEKKYNEAAVAKAKDRYNKEMEKVCGGENTYMNGEQLKSTHKGSMMRAMELFEENKKGDSETYKHQLQNEIEDSFKSHEKKNDLIRATAEANNMTAVAYAKDLYTVQMEKECGGKQTYIKDVDLYVCHDKCIHNALNEFKTTRKMGGNELSKKFETQLEKELLSLYESLKENNDLIRIRDEKNNVSAVAEAKDLYNTKMQEFCGGENPHLEGDLFHPLDTRSRTEAMELFAIKRMGSDEFSKTYEMKLVKELDHELQIHVKNNESNLIKEKKYNEAAVAKAKDRYNKEMEKVCGGENTYMNGEQLNSSHKGSMMRAMELFEENKKGDSKTYKHQLQNEIEDSFKRHIKDNDLIRERSKTDRNMLVGGIVGVVAGAAAGAAGMAVGGPAVVAAIVNPPVEVVATSYFSNILPMIYEMGPVLMTKLPKFISFL